MKNIKIAALLCTLTLVSACTTAPAIQPQVNAFLMGERYNQALNTLEAKKETYGPKNQLLYLMDKGFILHLMGRYKDSISIFEQAKDLIDEMYTKSVSNMASTWMVNDYLAPYRGENFEHILINVFQALNYAALGDINESLVEARDADLKFNAIRNLYSDLKEDTYIDDGFVRLLMGILYEASNNQQGLNDALISYKKSLELYESKHYKDHDIGTPRVLKENLLSAAQYLGFPELEEYKRKFPNSPFSSIREKSQKAEIYIIQYNGLSPVKHPHTIPVPTPDGYATGFSFPKYDARYYETKRSDVLAENTTGDAIESPTDLGEDIEILSHQAIDNRKAAIYSKAVIRPGMKYAAEKAIEYSLEDKYGRNAQYPVKGIGSLFNLFSEKADLRSWQTLPAQIRLTRLLLEPGKYKLSIENFDADNIAIEKRKIGEYTFQAGEKRFIIVRTIR